MATGQYTKELSTSKHTLYTYSDEWGKTDQRCKSDTYIDLYNYVRVTCSLRDMHIKYNSKKQHITGRS